MMLDCYCYLNILESHNINSLHRKISEVGKNIPTYLQQVNEIKNVSFKQVFIASTQGRPIHYV